MASSFKTLGSNDRTVSYTPLESDAGYVSGVWGPLTSNSESNNYFITYGTDRVGISYAQSGSTNLSSSFLYNQLCHQLLGYDQDGKLKEFKDLTGATSNSVPVKLAVYALPRSKIKDKLKPGSVKVTINNVDWQEDTGSYSECQTGWYSFLTNGINGAEYKGLVFHEAGIVVIDASVYANDPVDNSDIPTAVPLIKGGTTSIEAKAITELNSTIYFCRAFNNEFNYSSNPTYLKDSQIIVKLDDPDVMPHAYITTVGLYNDKEELLAVAKFSTPIKKSPETELIARVRLDF